MRLLLLLCSFFFCWNNFAQQNPDLFQTWYLNYVMVSDGEAGFVVEDIEPSISPTLTIYSNNNFEGVGACNTFNGMITFPDELYDNPIATVQFSNTNEDCAFETHNNFEDEYFEFFQLMSQYNITENDQGLSLSLATSIFGYALFTNYPLNVIENDKFKFSVYPNPVSSKLLITHNGYHIQKIEIFTLSGTIIKSIIRPKQEIDISNISNGMYYVKIHSNNGLEIKKILKK